MVFAAPTFAAESPPTRTPRVTATLVSDTDAVTAGTKLHLALRLELAPGWHTYWQNPGDAGIPPELTLNVPAGPIVWPAPQRLRAVMKQGLERIQRARADIAEDDAERRECDRRRELLRETCSS